MECTSRLHCDCKECFFFKRYLRNYANNFGTDFYLSLPLAYGMYFWILVLPIICYYLLLFFFYFLEGRAPVSEELDLPWCPVLCYTHCRNYFMFVYLID